MGSIGTLSFPPYVLHYALCFLDGRALTLFETASTGTKQVVDDTPGLYKTLLLRQIDNVPHMASLPRKEAKRALMSWEAGDFQPVLARVSGKKSPPPRYLHRVAEAADGWTYLHGGNTESGVSGDVWRFRVWEPKGRASARTGDGAPAPAPALKLRWEHVWGGDEENEEQDAGGNVSDSTSDSGDESDEDRESEGAVDGRGSGGGAAAAAALLPGMGGAPPNAAADGPPPAAQMHAGPVGAIAFGAVPALAADQVLVPPAPAAGLAGLAAGAAGAAQQAFHGAMLAANHGVLGVGFEDAAAVGLDGPRPRCAASWTAMPGTNLIYLFGGQGSENEFLDDLWCFHAGRRGECYWKRLDQVREPMPSDGGGGGGGGGGEGEDEDGGEGGGAAGPWRPPEGRWGHTMVEHRGLLYMFGGSSPGVAYAKLWRLDTSVSPCVWSLLSPARDITDTTAETGKPRARGGHSATVVRDSLYIFGGNITLSVFKDLWVVDLPACRSWRRVPDAPAFPPARIGHISVALGNRILIFGGRNFKTGVFTGGLYCFDVDLQAFVRFPHAEAFSPGAVQPGGMWNGLRMTGHAAVHCSRGLLVAGGLLPRGQSFTMGCWTLDVIGGHRDRGRQRRRRLSRMLERAAGGCTPS